MVLRALLFQPACSLPTLPRLQQIPAATVKEIFCSGLMCRGALEPQQDSLRKKRGVAREDNTL